MAWSSLPLLPWSGASLSGASFAPSVFRRPHAVWRSELVRSIGQSQKRGRYFVRVMTHHITLRKKIIGDAVYPKVLDSLGIAFHLPLSLSFILHQQLTAHRTVVDQG